MGNLATKEVTAATIPRTLWGVVMADLVLPLKREYFEAIAAGTKPEEFRLRTPYWQKRLEGRSYDRVVLTLGYPAINDSERRLVRPWRGFVMKRITHPHFGKDPVEVYAIDVAPEARREENFPVCVKIHHTQSF